MCVYTGTWRGISKVYKDGSTIAQVYHAFLTHYNLIKELWGFMVGVQVHVKSGYNYLQPPSGL